MMPNEGINDVNIKPSLIASFYQMEKDLKKIGFKERDILLLLQDRTKPKMALRDIKNMFNALKRFEMDFIKFKEIVGDIGDTSINR